MRHGSEGIRLIVNTLLSRSSAVTAGELAQEAQITRQAAHRHLAAFVEAGFLVREGKGRGSHYRAATSIATSAEARFRYALKDLAEDDVWTEVRARVPQLAGLTDNVERILHYAMTELVNNAIDHSGGSRVDVVFANTQQVLAFEVIDDGEGIFEHLTKGLGLADPFAAIQELSKGKTTTAPDRHTGEGIFFTSKAADFFELESGTIAWRVDNVRVDTSIASVPKRQGTRVRFEVSPAKTGTLERLFAEYTKDFEFSKTKIVVKLFQIGVRFVSRSEAKRILQGLERFKEVVFDFRGVQDIGQGFADEVFRVWPRMHKEVTIVPENMAPAVEFMVKRAQGGSQG